MKYCIFFFSSKRISKLEHLAGPVNDYVFYTPIMVLETKESRIES